VLLLLLCCSVVNCDVLVNCVFLVVSCVVLLLNVLFLLLCCSVVNCDVLVVSCVVLLLI
jgi:hypothetical protein